MMWQPYESMAVISSKKVASCLNCILFFWFLYMLGLWNCLLFLILLVQYVTLIFVLNFVGSVWQVLFHRFYCKKSFDRFNVKVKFCLLSFSLYIENKCRKEKCSLKCIHDVLIEVFGTISDLSGYQCKWSWVRTLPSLQLSLKLLKIPCVGPRFLRESLRLYMKGVLELLLDD